jgi:beta-aspartyl-peptidase (threonine type)
MSYSLIVHGGAGLLSSISAEQQQNFLIGIKDALNAGEQLLKDGKTALDVVEHCVMLMEDNPVFNAGKGSVLDENGKVDMDAGIMDGSNLAAGAVAGVKNVRNPIHLARLVMEKTEHVMLISHGAETFGKLSGIPSETDEYFITEQRIKGLEEAKKREKVVLDHDSVTFQKFDKTEKKYGTVGAVAFDKDGNLAAATSTGGITNKKFGRVGDSPIIGAGVYADNETSAVSATGYGEQFIRTSLSKMASIFIYFEHCSAQEASEKAMEYLERKVKGLGGIILIDRNGNLGISFSTEGMIRGWVREGEKQKVALWK